MSDGESSGRVFLSPPDVGSAERAALLRAFDSGWVAPVGPELDAFEAELAAFVGWPGVVAMSSGTAALHLALAVHGVNPGDEVIVSTFTFAATANAVTYVGATPRFVDSDAATWNMSPELLADELAAMRADGRLPAAVVVVDLYGQCADYDEIVPLCVEYGVPVIEDAAEALGASYRGRSAGTLGDCGIFSFNGNKIMTTSGGGAFASPDVAVADRVRYLATQARQPAVHYEHTEIGFNYRLSNLLAAMGRAQLDRLPEMSVRRRSINAFYRRALGGVTGLSFMPTVDGWNGWLTCVTFDDARVRDRVQSALAAVDIESRPLWKPMHLQPVFADAPARVDGTSEHLFTHGLCLPSGSALTDGQVERVISVAAAATVEGERSVR
ncbi:MAG: aminotransferase class I/II-fold pyridoxal phosphate-dependent enzyme [Ilumatobacteraceae bacterium]